MRFVTVTPTEPFNLAALMHAHDRYLRAKARSRRERAAARRLRAEQRRFDRFARAWGAAIVDRLMTSDN